MQAWNVWMDKYNPRVDQKRLLRSLRLPNVGFAVVQLLRQCGDNLTRENYHEAGFPSRHGAAVAAARDPPEDQFGRTCARSNKCGSCVLMASAMCCSATYSQASNFASDNHRDAIAARRQRVIS